MSATVILCERLRPTQAGSGDIRALVMHRCRLLLRLGAIGAEPQPDQLQRLSFLPGRFWRCIFCSCQGVNSGTAPQNRRCRSQRRNWSRSSLRGQGHWLNGPVEPYPAQGTRTGGRWAGSRSGGGPSATWAATLPAGQDGRELRTAAPKLPQYCRPNEAVRQARQIAIVSRGEPRSRSTPVSGQVQK